jgi:hypothetical protein
MCILWMYRCTHGVPQICWCFLTSLNHFIVFTGWISDLLVALLPPSGSSTDRPHMLHAIPCGFVCGVPPNDLIINSNKLTEWRSIRVIVIPVPSRTPLTHARGIRIQWCQTKVEDDDGAKDFVYHFVSLGAMTRYTVQWTRQAALENTLKNT